MDQNLSFSDINPDSPSYLIVLPTDKRPWLVSLEAGNSLFVGSGNNCKVILPSDKVQQIHCMVWLDETQTLNIQDWNTGETIVNGHAITDEMAMKSGDRVTIADFQLIPVLDREFHLGFAQELIESPPRMSTETPQPIATPPVDVPTNLSVNTTNTTVQATTPEQTLAPATEQVVEPVPLAIQPAPEIPAAPVAVQSTAPTSFVAPEPFVAEAPGNDPQSFAYDVNADLNQPAAHQQNAFNQFPGEPFDQGFSFPTDDVLGTQTGDASEMLTIENEQLRFELAERDLLIQSLQENSALTSGAEMVDTEQTEKLVNRLEELLLELRSADDRVRGLEELLRVSDEATRAEQDERQQLEQWVSEIEDRLGYRDEEAKVEIERLTQRLAAEQQRTVAAAQQLQQLVAETGDSSGGELSANAKQIMQDNQQEIESLRSQLDAANDQVSQLRQASPTDEGGVGVAEKLKTAEAELVELRVQASRERAETARRQAELERIREELEDRLSRAKQVDKGDSRIMAMRAHLREIHEQEKSVESEKKESLGGRIANLLSRLR